MYTNGTDTISGKRIEVDGRVILNPTEQMLADAGWIKVEPIQPSEEELAAQARAAEVEELKMQLAEAEQLHSERQALRDRINELEGEQ